MRPLQLPVLLLAGAALLTASPSLSAAAPDLQGSGYRVQAASDGHFVLRPESLRGAAASSLSGIVNQMVSRDSLVMFSQLPGSTGGLYRSTVRMDKDPDPVEIFNRVQAGRNAGMQVLLTMVGTQEWNSTGPPGTEPLWGLPEHAKAPPADFQLWADTVRDLLLDAQAQYGVLPDYVEFWNEADLDLWWTGTREELLDLYEVFANTLRAAFPNKEFEIGGMGLGLPMSTMEGTNTVFDEMIHRCAASGAPLEFLSWHHYDLASGLRFHPVVDDLRSALTTNGMAGVKLFVTEWNLWGRPEGHPRAIELDESHAAANLAGFLSSISDLDLDGQCFYLLQDDTGWDPQISDLTGAGPGGLTRRGIKKPVWRMMEFIYPMSQESRVDVQFPTNEWAVSAFATRMGDRVRVVVANDCVEPDWVWAEGCKERGALPGKLWGAVSTLQKHGYPVTHDNLVSAGLDPYEADVALEVLVLMEDAQTVYENPRQIELDVQGAGNVSLAQVWRFDHDHNNPAERREEVLPMLQWVEADADYQAWMAASQFLQQNGATPPPYGTELHVRTAQDLANALNIPLEVAQQTFDIYMDTLDEQRMAHTDLLNNLPATVLQMELPADAGLTLAGNTIQLAVEPNAAMVIDFWYK